MKKNRIFHSVYCTFLILIFLAANSEKIIPASTDKDSVIVAGIILKWVPKDPEKNYQRFEVLVRQAASQKAQIVCTTECFLDGYSIRDTKMSAKEFRTYAVNSENGKYVTRIKNLAKELGIYLIAGLAEAKAVKIYNSAILINPVGKVAGIYRKNYLWGYEKDKFSRGKGFPVFPSPYGKIGMMICYERRKPEVIANLKKNGAHIIFCLSGGGYGAENDRIVSLRSLESQLPIIFVHPVEFLVTGPNGKILYRNIYGNQLDDNGDETGWGVVKMYKLTL